MNKIPVLIIGFVVSAFVSLSAQQNKFVLKGHSPKEAYEGATVYLQKISDDMKDFVKLDSTFIKNHGFTFESQASAQPTIYFVSLQLPNEWAPPFLFSPQQGEINMTIGDNYQVSGTPLNDEINRFMQSRQSIMNDLNKLFAAYQSPENPYETEEDFMKEAQLYKNNLQDVSFKFAQKNINNGIGEFFLISLYELLSGEQMLQLIGESRPQFKNSETGKQLANYFEFQGIKEGKGRYRDMVMQDPEGNEVALSDYVGKGKYVLIDFWASWCGPCIKEMPSLVEAYNQYKDKGFEIVGVSLDDNKKSWLSAIDRLNMSWVHMSDLKGWESLAGSVYGVNSIPFTLLVDGEGNIVASYLYGVRLKYKLEEIFN